MRKPMSLVMLVAAILLLQMVLRFSLPSAVATPNLLLALVICLAFLRGQRAGLFLGLVAGLLSDLFFGGGLFGLQTLLFTYIGTLCGTFGTRFFDNDLKMPLLLVAAGDVLCGIALCLTEAALSRHLAFGAALRRAILPEMIATVLLTIPLYPLVRLICNRISAREMEEQNSPWLRR